MTDFVAIPQCLRRGGVHADAPSEPSYACLRDAIKVPTTTDNQTIGFSDFPPPGGWRRIAPADCVGTPAISMQYAAELQRLAEQQGIEVRAGDTLTAKYRRIDDEWHPIPETLEVTR